METSSLDSGGGGGLRLEDHNNLKYAISLTRVGQALFSKVFTWGYTQSSQTIKSTLFKLPGYSNTKFRKDFNTSQRDKINKGDLLSMDITLLYKLLQLICGLRDHNDDVWITPTSDSLEYCLYAIKVKRNEIAHEEFMLSPTQLTEKLKDLQMLFLETIHKASTAFNIDVTEKNNFVNIVNCQLDGIRDSPVPLPTIAEYEKEVLVNRKLCVIDEGQQEMARIRDVVCQTSVVPCLSEETVNVNLLYTEPKLKRDETQISQRQLSMDESYVNVHDIFETRECDSFRPDAIVISGLNGMGKSTLLKYIIENGFSDVSVIKNIENLDLILFLECRKVTFSSVDEFASLLLPRTSAMFQQKNFTQSLLSIDFLLMLDDVDELDQNSFMILEKFIRLVSPGTRIVLTASREKAKYVQRKVSAIHKRAMLLELEGITEKKTLKHLQKVLRSIPSKSKNHDNEQKLYELVRSKYPYLQEHLRSPEVLGLIAFGWSYAPDRINATTTVSEIFLLVEDLLMHKIFLSLTCSSLPSMHDQGAINSKLYDFLLTLSSVAADTLRKEKFSIDPEDLQKIVDECSNLDLPKSIISLFLSYLDEENTQPLVISRKVSFPRRSTLQYYAAWFTTQKLKEASHEATIKDFMQFTVVDDAAVANYQVMVKYLVGMLASLIPSQLEYRAREIVNILKELEVNKASLWLQYIEEAKEEPTITHEILKKMGDAWEVEDYAISLTLKNILKKKKPSRLGVIVCKTPSDIPHLQQVLQTCKDFQDMTISLQLYKHFWSEKTEFSDQYLKMLTGSNSSCKLEHFAGRLSEDAIPLLPNSLKRLALHITPDMITTLNTCLVKLTQLQMLYINLDISETVDPLSVPSLNLLQKSVVFSVDMWKIHQGTVDWACDVAKALSDTFARLVLRHSSLEISSCMKWLMGLHERQITVSWIVVGSTCDITEEDNCQLQQCASNIGCTKFVWLKI